MESIITGLAAVAFWVVVGLFVWLNHVQYMAGHDTAIFTHKTPEEIRIREAVIKKLEAEAKASGAEQ